MGCIQAVYSYHKSNSLNNSIPAGMLTVTVVVTLEVDPVIGWLVVT